MNDDKTMTKREEQNPERMQQRQWVSLPVDIYENSKEILLLADMPGVITDNLKISLDKDALTIEGSRPKLTEGSVLVQGYEELDYLRSFKLPNTIDTAKIDAELSNGILTVHLPKHESVQPRRITVKGS